MGRGLAIRKSESAPRSLQTATNACRESPLPSGRGTGGGLIGGGVTELIWDGKYDAQGRRVAPLRVRLPFQTVETVNESAQERNLAFDLFAQGRDPQWRNRLIWGDKKYVLPALLGQIRRESGPDLY